MVYPKWRNRWAGWGGRQTNEPQLPTLRRFGIGVVALLMIIVGMKQARVGVMLDVWVLVGGGVALWLWRFGRKTSGANAVIGAAHLHMRHWWAGALIAAVALGVLVWRWRSLSVDFPTDADWLWYLGSIGMIVLAAAVVEEWRGIRWPVQWPVRVSGAGWMLAGIVVAGALVRLVALDSLPFGTWYDEAANGLEALRVAREPQYRPLYTDGVNSTGHYLWLIVGAFKLFGESTFAVRSISAAMGIATILAAYLAGRELFGQRLGLVFALLVAFARWSITFSRLGMYNSATPLFELLALFWLLRALRRGSVLDFTLAGVAVGLGLCFYSAFQLFVVVLGLFVLVVLWQERARWRVLVVGLVISAVAALVVIAPVAKYVIERPQSYFARVQATSLFADKRPEERLPALWENTRKHLLMFNVRGDPNGRHNLPGEPMLDWISGGLLVAGMATSLRRGLAPRYLLIPVWAFVGLLGGILSLDFEAPQSLRAIGSQPAVLLAACLPIGELSAEWRRGAGRYLPNAGIWVVGLLFLLPAGVSNLHTYFVRQAHDFASWNAHSTPETIAAHLLRGADPAVDKYLISLYDGHPTVRFLAPNANTRRVETNTTLPLLREMPNGMMLILDTERQALYQEARRLYPSSAFQEIRPPFGGPAVIYVNELSLEDLQSVQGLYATYSSEEADAVSQVRKEMAIDLAWPQDAPVAPPFVADWSGVLAVNTFGPYQFFVQAPGHVTLWIGEAVVIDGDGSGVDGLGGGLMLARGNHTVHLRADGGEGRVRLVWQPPDGPPALVPSWAFYVPPVQSNGLLGHYYSNAEWSGEPTFAQIDPRLSIYFHVPTLPRPYTVEWSGKLAIPADGHYEFGLQSIDESSLLIDGVEVVASNTRNEMAVGGLTLEAGLRDVVVRYRDRTDHTYINLSWRPPGGDSSFRIIPSELLFPPRENYDRVDVGDLAQFVMRDVQLPTEVVRDQIEPATVEVVADGLSQPRGVAIHDRIVYVAEAGQGRVLAFDSESGERVASPLDAWSFEEPFDIAVQPDGSVIVLDATSGQLIHYDPANGAMGALPVEAPIGERSRGISAGLTGEVWVANTAGERVVAIDSQGVVLQEIALPAVTSDQPALQPVDVAVMPDNTIYVTDVAGHMLYRFSLAGYLLSSQPIPVANSLDSAHLAVDGAGLLYMTEPEAGRVAQLDPSGLVRHIWSVRVDESQDAKPVGIAVADDGAIWVADSQGGKLLRVSPEVGE